MPVVSTKTNAKPSLDGVLSRKDFESGRVYALSELRVPEVLDLGAISHPLRRNALITEWYDRIDHLMVGYMGTPALPSWATFGKHASYNAGRNLRQVLWGLELFTDLKALRDDLADGVGFNAAEIGKVRRKTIEVFRGLQKFLEGRGVAQVALGLFVYEARAVLAESLSQYAMPAEQAQATRVIDRERVVAFSKELKALKISVLSSIYKNLTALKQFYDVLADANQKIYEFIAPNFVRFLEQATQAPQGVPQRLELVDDELGLLQAGFANYAKARGIALRLQQIDRTAQQQEYEALVEERTRLVEEANFMIVLNEQLRRVQPLYDPILRQMGRVSRILTLVEPDGAHRILPTYQAGNWGDLVTRMGLDPESMPCDLSSISPTNLPRFLPRTDPRFKGTIGNYFQRGIRDPEYFLMLHTATPSRIESPDFDYLSPR